MKIKLAVPAKVKAKVNATMQHVNLFAIYTTELA